MAIGSGSKDARSTSSTFGGGARHRVDGVVSAVRVTGCRDEARVPTSGDMMLFGCLQAHPDL